MLAPLTGRILKFAFTALAFGSALALALRALLGPYSVGPVSIGSPVNAQCLFGASLMALLVGWAQVGNGDPGGNAPRQGFPWWMPAVAGLSAAGAFSPALGFYLLSDDFCFLADAHSYLRSFPATAGHYFFRPIQFLYGGLVNAAAGDNLVLWHAAGLFIHGAATAAFFFLARQLCRSAWAALAASLAFGLHGSRPEAVAWIAGWTDVLAGGFLIAGLAFYLRETRPVRPSRMAVSLFLFAAGACAKETGFIFPLLLPVADWWKQTPLRQAATRWAVFAAVALSLFLWRWHALGGLGGYTNPVTGRSEILSMGFLGPTKTLLLRLWGPLFFPWNWSREPTMAAALSLAAAAALYWTLFRFPAPRRAAWFALSVTILASLPALPQLLIGADLEKSRALYLPAAGFCLLLGILAEGRRRLFCAFAVVAFHGLALQHNLAIWSSVSSLAREVCRDATLKMPPGTEKVTVLGVPGKLEGVYLFQNCIGGCLAREGAPGLVWACQEPGAVEPCPRQDILVLRWNARKMRLEPETQGWPAPPREP